MQNWCGLSLDKVLRKGGIFPRIVHKELGTMLRKRSYCYSQKVDIPFSVQQLYRPEEIRKVKEKGRCPYTSLLTKIQLIQFIALFFLSISSVSTEQWQLYAMNMKATKIERGNPFFWWDSQLFSEKSKKKFLFMMKNPETTKSFCNKMFNKLIAKLSKFCKEAGFMHVFEIGQYFVSKDTGSLRQSRSVACREYTLPRDDKASQPKGWIRGNMRIGPVLEITTSFQHFKYGIELKFEFGLWVKTILIPGSCRLQLIKPGEDLVWISRSWKICCKWWSIGETSETVTTR